MPSVAKVVTIYRNVEQDSDGRPVGVMDGYSPGHAMTPVFVYVTETSDVLSALNEAFELFNAPEDYLSPEQRSIQRRYYANRTASLSIGDVIQVGGQFNAVSRFGWTEVPAGSLRIVAANPYDQFTDERIES